MHATELAARLTAPSNMRPACLPHDAKQLWCACVQDQARAAARLDLRRSHEISQPALVCLSQNTGIKYIINGFPYLHTADAHDLGESLRRR